MLRTTACLIGDCLGIVNLRTPIGRIDHVHRALDHAPAHAHNPAMTPSAPRTHTRPLLLALSLCAASVHTQMCFSQTPAAPPPASPAPAPAALDQEEKPELIVYLKDGRRFSGLLVKQNADEVIIQISGIPTRFPTEQIDRFERLEPVLVRYRQLRESVGDDPEQIVTLAQWLQSRERYELAFTEVQRALKIDPTNANALRLRVVLEQQILLKARAQRPKPDDKKPDEPAPAPRHRSIDFPLLTDPQIELMKVYEVDLKDNPRVLISRDTITRMLDRYATHPLVPITREGREAIYRKTPAEILDLMFRLQAREFYSNVEILDQPRPFVSFREQVSRTWLLNSCATNQCHGGADAGRLVLHNKNPNSENTIYTNFYILSNFKLADGTPLIDWEQPDRSPLLQMGLPRERSRFPHPPVIRGAAGHDAFKPAFRNTEDRSFQASVDWLKSVYRPRPRYPFEYTPLKPFTPSPAEARPSPAENPAPAQRPAPPPRPATDNPAPPAGRPPAANPGPSDTPSAQPQEPPPR